MGMTKASLDLQIQADTQRAIATLQKNMTQLERVLQIVDGNMRQSHVVLFQDTTQLRIRVNFLMCELKKNMTSDEEKELEARFMDFAKAETAKMDENIAKAINAREAAAEKQAESLLEKEKSPNDTIR